MAYRTGIEWCDHTFNPWWGCSRLSPACDNCYAQRDAKRWGYGGVWGPNRMRRHFGDAHWREPLRWDRKAAFENRRDRVFCGSMCDWLEMNTWDLGVALDRERLLPLIERTMNLDWLLLTKRPERVVGVPWLWSDNYWPRNAWFGVTLENQERADDLMPGILKNTAPAPVVFVSAEPLLGPLTLEGWYSCMQIGRYDVDAGCCEMYGQTGDRHFLGVDWVIVGGESGPEARPTNPDWVRSLRTEAEAAGIAFFFKQWGEWLPESQVPTDRDDLVGVSTPVWEWPDGSKSYRVGRKAAGCLLDGATHQKFPMPRPRGRPTGAPAGAYETIGRAGSRS